MNKKYIIIGTIGLFLFASISAMAFSTPDYPHIIDKQSSAVAAQVDKLKVVQCEYIGVLTLQCYKKQGGACDKLQNEQKMFKSYFDADSATECFSHDTSTDPVEGSEDFIPGQPIPLTVTPESDPKNPVFFGDEGSSR